MQDAVALTILINVIRPGTTAEMESLFKEYKDERMPRVIHAYYHDQSKSHLTGSVSAKA